MNQVPGFTQSSQANPSVSSLEQLPQQEGFSNSILKANSLGEGLMERCQHPAQPSIPLFSNSNETQINESTSLSESIAPIVSGFSDDDDEFAQQLKAEIEKLQAEIEGEEMGRTDEVQSRTDEVQSRPEEMQVFEDENLKFQEPEISETDHAVEVRPITEKIIGKNISITDILQQIKANNTDNLYVPCRIGGKFCLVPLSQFSPEDQKKHIQSGRVIFYNGVHAKLPKALAGLRGLPVPMHNPKKPSQKTAHLSNDNTSVFTDDEERLLKKELEEFFIRTYFIQTSQRNETDKHSDREAVEPQDRPAEPLSRPKHTSHKIEIDERPSSNTEQLNIQKHQQIANAEEEHINEITHEKIRHEVKYSFKLHMKNILIKTINRAEEILRNVKILDLLHTGLNGHVFSKVTLDNIKFKQ